MRRVLSRVHADWKIVTVGSGVEALEALEERCCDVLVTDLVMPDMRGEELLAKVREAYPGVIRVIHSGELDPERPQPAEDLAHLVVVKPATSGELIETLDAAMSLARSKAARCAGE